MSYDKEQKLVALRSLNSAPPSFSPYPIESRIETGTQTYAFLLSKAAGPIHPNQWLHLTLESLLHFNGGTTFPGNALSGSAWSVAIIVASSNSGLLQSVPSCHHLNSEQRQKSSHLENPKASPASPGLLSAGIPRVKGCNKYWQPIPAKEPLQKLWRLTVQTSMQGCRITKTQETMHLQKKLAKLQ